MGDGLSQVKDRSKESLMAERGEGWDTAYAYWR